MINLQLIKNKDNIENITIFSGIVEALEIETYSESIELEFDFKGVNMRIEYNKKDKIEMIINLV